MGDGVRHVYIVGCKGIPARYGGFETFVEKLTENRASDGIRYHVACAVDEMPEKPEYEHNGAHCFCVEWRPIGAARAVAYDLDALGWAIRHAERNGVERPVFYVLACRIGPFVGRFARIFLPQDAERVRTSELAWLLAEVQGARIYLSSLLSDVVRPFFADEGILGRLFGNLRYDLSTTGSVYDYRLTSLEESARKSFVKHSQAVHKSD